MEIMAIHGISPGTWVCEIRVGEGASFWIACYKGVMSPWTFGSAGGAGKEIDAMREAAAGGNPRVTLDLAHWQLEADDDLTRGLAHAGARQVWRAFDRFGAVRLGREAPTIHIIIDLGLQRCAAFNDEADLLSTERALDI